MLSSSWSSSVAVGWPGRRSACCFCTYSAKSLSACRLGQHDDVSEMHWLGLVWRTLSPLRRSTGFGLGAYRELMMVRDLGGLQSSQVVVGKCRRRDWACRNRNLRNECSMECLSLSIGRRVVRELPQKQVVMASSCL
jgi:hypothetical protein